MNARVTSLPRSVVRWLRALTLRTLAAFALAIVASVGFVVISAYVRHGVFDQVDISTELEVHKLDSPTWDFLMKSASFIGSNLFLLPMCAVVMWLCVRRQRRKAAVILAVDAVVAIGLDNLLKMIFQRDRPTILDKIAVPTGYSFPSGHSMSAMGIWGVVAAVIVYLYPRTKRPIIGAAVLLIAAIGFSRIYLGAHWPFDVVGGFLGGIPLLVVSVHLLHRDPRREHDTNVADLMIEKSSAPGAAP